MKWSKNGDSVEWQLLKDKALKYALQAWLRNLHTNESTYPPTTILQWQRPQLYLYIVVVL